MRSANWLFSQKQMMLTWLLLGNLNRSPTIQAGGVWHVDLVSPVAFTGTANIYFVFAHFSADV
jgi:hypothetical protein